MDQELIIGLHTRAKMTGFSKPESMKKKIVKTKYFNQEEILSSKAQSNATHKAIY